MAKNEITRISVNALERITGDEEKTVAFNWEGEEVIVKKRLNLAEMLTMVDSVASGCFAEDASYHPEARQFAMDCAILEMYANFRLPQNIEKRYDLVCSEAVVMVINMIVARVDGRQLSMIEDAITEKIDYRINTQTAAVERQLYELSKQIEEVGAGLTEIFKDTTPDEVKGILGALAQGVDEEKIVDAVVKARAGDTEDGADSVDEAPLPDQNATSEA